MTPPISDLLVEASNGDPLAHEFLLAWCKTAHACDDLVDEGLDREGIVRLFASINWLYSHPFYVAHTARLQAAVFLCLNAYADSVEWEKSDVAWRRSWADTLRFAGNDVILAVAGITGGFDHMRRISTALRTRSWVDHHNDDSNPV